MGIQVRWDNPQQDILLCVFEETWNWQDYHAAMQQGRALIDSVDHSVDVIFDFQRTHFAPSGALRHLGNSFRSLADANLNRLVIVSATGILHIIVEVLTNLYPRTAASMSQAVTMKEAYKLLGHEASAGG